MDLISKLSEIRSEYNCFDEDEESKYRALSVAIKILSQSADGDTISRQEAIDALQREKTYSTAYKDGYTQTDYFKQYNMGLTDGIKALNKLPSVQPEQRWIPTSKKLPEYDKPVLLSTAWGKTEIGFWTQRGWMIVVRSYRELEKGAVDAWMPLPKPYEEDKQND